MSIFTRTMQCPGCGNSARIRDEAALNAAFEEEIFASWKCRRCGVVLMPRFFASDIVLPGSEFDARFKHPPQADD